MKRSENFNFNVVSEPINSFIEKKIVFDVVLALGGFNRFLLNKETFNQLKELLQKLKMKEMFFQPSIIKSEMNTYYKNLSDDDWVEFILKYSCLLKSKRIGYAEDGSSLYKLY